MNAFAGRVSVVVGGLVAAAYCQFAGIRMFVDDPSSETAIVAASVMGAGVIVAQVTVSLAMGWTTAGRCDDALRLPRPTRSRGHRDPRHSAARASRARPRCGGAAHPALPGRARRGSAKPLHRAGRRETPCGG